MKKLSLLLVLVCATGVVLADNYTVVAVPTPARWVLPVTVFKAPDLYGAAAGLGYQFRNRYTLSAQVLYANLDNSEETTIFEKRVETGGAPDGCIPPPGRGHGHGHCFPGPGGSTVVTRSSSDESYSNKRIGVAVTLTIPLSKR